MYRTQILPMDAIIAVSLVDLSMQDCTLSDTINALHSTIPQYPDYDYLVIAKRLLTRLSLYEIWKEELFYYGKILNVDSRTLESEIDNHSTNLFTKFDDVSDENIPLSSSLVTSSYFHNKKTNHDCKDVKEEFRDSDGGQINARLAATLKKHAALHKVESVNTKVKKSIKRKRKEVTVNIDEINDKITKRANKRNISKKNNKDKNESDKECDVDILKAVPSVNDVFSDLNLQFNSDRDSQDKENYDKTSNDTNHEITISNAKSDVKDSKNKLQQFQFVRKHDLDKYYDNNIQNNKSITATVHNENSINQDVTLIERSASNIVSTSRNTNLISSTQISIFDSSDCDIDLEI